jgi:hypothetical protein
LVITHLPLPRRAERRLLLGDDAARAEADALELAAPPDERVRGRGDDMHAAGLEAEVERRVKGLLRAEAAGVVWVELLEALPGPGVLHHEHVALHVVVRAAPRA